MRSWLAGLALLFAGPARADLAKLTAPPAQRYALSPGTTDYFTPQMFGAKADCKTPVNDGPAIQNAVNACAASGAKRCLLHFPPGCYYTKNSIETSSAAYVTFEGSGRFNTYVYNVSGSSGAFVLNSASIGGSPAQIDNRGAVVIKDIAIGSTQGAALFWQGANNSLVDDVYLFSAGTGHAYLEIRAGAQNQFSNMIIDNGNTNTAASDPNGYWSGNPTLTKGINDILMQPITPPGATSQENIAENDFINIRTGDQITGDSVRIISSTETFAIANNKFTNVNLKAIAGFSCWNIDGGSIWITNSYCEPQVTDTNGIVVADSTNTVSVFVNNLSANTARLYLKSANGQSNSIVSVSNSAFRRLAVDNPPADLYIMNTIFVASTTGTGAITSATRLNFSNVSVKLAMPAAQYHDGYTIFRSSIQTNFVDARYDGNGFPPFFLSGTQAAQPATGITGAANFLAAGIWSGTTGGAFVYGLSNAGSGTGLGLAGLSGGTSVSALPTHISCRKSDGGASVTGVANGELCVGLSNNFGTPFLTYQGDGSSTQTSSATFMATGASYSIQTSSGVKFGSGVIVSSGTSPTVSCDAGSPIMQANATSNHGRFIAGAAATSCTVTFTQNFPKAPDCICGDDTSTGVGLKAVTTTTSVACSAATISNDTITYLCFGAP